MRVVIVGPAYPLRGGIAHHTSLLYQQLVKSHDVTVATFKRQYPALLFPGKTQMEAGGELLRIPSEQLVDSINPLNWVHVGRRIKAMRPDLLIFRYWLPFFGPCFGTIARIVKRNAHTTVMYLCDNIVPHEKRPGDGVFTRYAFTPADVFIVQSTIVERDLLTIRPGAKYRKVPHPVYNIFGGKMDKREARTALGLTHERIILFFGYVRPYKGLDVLIDAMAEVSRRLDVHLMVVGEFYHDEREYRARVSRLGLDIHVTFHPDYIPNEFVAKYFSASDAVVLPYRSATQSGIAQIAYNFDRPVITTNVGGLAEVVLDNVTGFLVPPGDVTALAGSICRFYEENRMDEFERNVQIEKRKYTWEGLARAIEELAAESRNVVPATGGT